MVRVKVPSRRNKFNAVKTMYNGWKYDSKAEAAYAKQLDMDDSVAFWLRQAGVDLGQDTRYRADFLVIESSGKIYFVDVKGKETAAWKRTKKLWRKYGELPLHVVKKGNTVEIIEGIL